MNKFNVGDKVVRVGSDFLLAKVGDIYTVEGFSKDCSIYLEEIFGEFDPEYFELVDKHTPDEAIPPEVVALGDKLAPTQTECTDKHYDAIYKLTEKDIERGWIKIDPYRVSKQWHLGSKDESGALFHNKNKYSREIKPNIFVDVYDVLRAFGVVDPCLSHLTKKALCAGLRGHKDRLEDLMDIKASIERAIEMHEEWGNDG